MRKQTGRKTETLIFTTSPYKHKSILILSTCLWKALFFAFHPESRDIGEGLYKPRNHNRRKYMEVTTYMKETEAAAYLNCAPITLAKDRCDQKLGIPFYKLGRCVRYKKDDLDAWMESRRVDPQEGKEDFFPNKRRPL
jgi:excisionase family DNA binding protein